MFKLDAHKLLIAIVMTAGVAACGGGGGGGGSAPGEPAASSGGIAASALASVDGLVAFMNQLMDTGTNDTSEPILLGDASLPVDNAI
jgi:hypothetical protein